MKLINVFMLAGDHYKIITLKGTYIDKNNLQVEKHITNLSKDFNVALRKAINKSKELKVPLIKKEGLKKLDKYKERELSNYIGNEGVEHSAYLKVVNIIKYNKFDKEHYIINFKDKKNRYVILFTDYLYDFKIDNNYLKYSFMVYKHSLNKKNFYETIVKNIKIIK